MLTLTITFLLTFAASNGMMEANMKLKTQNKALLRTLKELSVGAEANAGACTETQGYANNKIEGGESHFGLDGKQGCKEKCARMPDCACYAGKYDGYCHTGDATECSNLNTGDATDSEWIWGKCTLPRPWAAEAAQTEAEPATSEPAAKAEVGWGYYAIPDTCYDLDKSGVKADLGQHRYERVCKGGDIIVGSNLCCPMGAWTTSALGTSSANPCTASDGCVGCTEGRRSDRPYRPVCEPLSSSGKCVKYISDRGSRRNLAMTECSAADQ